MAKPKGGLGRGLGSLFEDTTPMAGSDAGASLLPLSEIEPDPGQPRQVFKEQALEQLAESIRANGLVQPIVVRPRHGGVGYIIIAGERRWRASRMAGLQEVPVVIQDVSEEKALELALIENLQREDLDPMEEARGYRQLMERCHLTQAQAAERLGKSRPALANSLRLLELPGEVQQAVAEGGLSVGHAKVILGLAQAGLQQKAAALVLAGGLNVRQTEELCKRLARGEGRGRPVSQPPGFALEVQAGLSEALGCKVKVDMKKNGKGSLTVPFFSEEQLKAYAQLLAKIDMGR